MISFKILIIMVKFPYKCCRLSIFPSENLGARYLHTSALLFYDCSAWAEEKLSSLPSPLQQLGNGRGGEESLPVKPIRSSSKLRVNVCLSVCLSGMTDNPVKPVGCETSLREEVPKPIFVHQLRWMKTNRGKFTPEQVMHANEFSFITILSCDCFSSFLSFEEWVQYLVAGSEFKELWDYWKILKILRHKKFEVFFGEV